MGWKLFCKRRKNNPGFSVPAGSFLILCLLLVPGICGTAVAKGPPGQVTETGFAHPLLDAAGRQETILSVDHPGRYAVAAESAEGVALQIVDILSGPGEVSGVPGKEDGRLDLFLDRGEYKVITLGHGKSLGKVALSARKFEALHRRPEPVVVDKKLVEATLSDLQERSWWLRVKERKTVFMESAGRSLADLRVWKDGRRMVAAVPVMEVIEPTPGRPMNAFRLSCDLNPGLYRVTAYGGPSLAWSRDGKQHPLYLRIGIPSLGEAGSISAFASPFGIDRWLVPQGADYFRLELPVAESAEMIVTDFDKRTPFSSYGKHSWITKKSLPPVAEIRTQSNQRGGKLVTVKREPGKPYTLIHFTQRDTYRFSKSGRYWLSTIHGGDSRDMADTTALLLKETPKGKVLVEGSTLINIDNSNGFRRSFNLTGPLTLFFIVYEKGRFHVGGSGPSARFRVEPYGASKPPGYRAPNDENSGHGWELSPGYYELTVTPFQKHKGIIDLFIRPSGLKEIAPSGPRTAARFPELFLDSKNSYTLRMNSRTGIASGMILRKLPIDLGTPFPLTLMPNESLTLPVMIGEPGRIISVSGNERMPDLFITDGEIAGPAGVDPSRMNSLDGGMNVDKGVHTLLIRNPESRSLSFSLRFTPDRLWDRTPLPRLTEAALAAIPDFPVLGEEKERFFDLSRKEKRSFLVKVDAPALYRLETTGLLATEGNLRTAIIPSLAENHAGGTGRNFLLQQYLRAGDYQLTVAASGKTKGRLGLRLSKNPLSQVGKLTPAIPARHLLKSGKGALFEFHIPEKGKYHLRAMGLGRDFPIRLEDEAGWPLLKPGLPGDITMEFPSGNYRLIVLPGNVDARLVALLNKVPERTDFTGKGPHALAARHMGKKIRHTWMEPEKDGPRLPDSWEFTAPAPANTTIELSEGMSGKLFMIDDSGKKELKGAIPPGKAWKNRIQEGRHRVEVKSIRNNNRFDYTINIAFRELLPGQPRSIEAPAELFLSIGKSGPVDLYSMGKNDVRASLYSIDGKLIAKNDDGDSDWNFHIAETLAPGEYRLKVEVSDGSGAATTVFMAQPEKEDHQPLRTPAHLVFTGDRVRSFPLLPPEKGAAVVISAASTGNLSITLRKKEGASLRTLGTASGKDPLLAFLPQPNGTTEGNTVEQGEPEGVSANYSLTVRPADGRKDNISLAAYTLSPEEQYESDLSGNGVIPKASAFHKERMPTAVFAKVRLDRPGIFQLDALEKRNIYWASEETGTFLPAADGIIPATGKVLWLMVPVDGRADEATGPVRARRISASAKEMEYTLPPAHSRIDIENASTGPLMVIAESTMGQPGVRILEPGMEQPGNNIPEAGPDRPAANTPENPSTAPVANMATGENAAVSVSLAPEKPAALLWNGGNMGKPLPITIRKHAFEKPMEETCDWGITDLSMESRGCRNLRLPSGRKNIRMVLPPETAAVLVKELKIEGVHWSGTRSMVKTVRSDASLLVLLHAGSVAATAGLKVAPGSEEETPFVLNPGEIFKHRFSTSGTFDLKVNLPSNAGPFPVYLNLSGSRTERVFIDNSGRVSRSFPLRVQESGILTIRHAPGFLTAWMEGGKADPRQGMDGAVLIENDEAVLIEDDAPRNLTIDGHGTSIRFLPDKPLMLHLKTGIPVIVRISPPEPLPVAESHTAEKGKESGITQAEEKNASGLSAFDATPVDEHKTTISGIAETTGNSSGKNQLFPEGANLSLYLPGGKEALSRPTTITLIPMNTGQVSGRVELQFTGIREIGEGMGPAVRLGPGDSRLFSFNMESDGPVGIGVNGPSDAATCRLWNEGGKLLGKGPVQMHELLQGKYMLSVDNPPDSDSMEVRPVVVGVEPPGTGPPLEVMERYIKK